MIAKLDDLITNASSACIYELILEKIFGATKYVYFF